MTLLDDSVRIIVVQFGFSNFGVVPESVRQMDSENEGEQRNRRARNNSKSKMIIEPTENVSLVEFLNDLEAAGYELVDGFYQPRIHPKNPQMYYHMVRFLYVRHEYAQPFDKLYVKRVRADLRKICKEAVWRTRAYLNPFFVDGEEVEGVHTLSVNLVARKPLYSSNGQPFTVWQKDEEGEHVGEAAVPIKPDHCLRILDNIVQITP